MPRTKALLPPEIAEPLGQLSAEVTSLSRQLEDEIYRLAVVEKRPVTAVARAAGIDEEVMKKRVARIRLLRGDVQTSKAA